MISTPCIKICKLNSQDICIGCGRTLYQIKHWHNYSEEKRKLIIKGLDILKESDIM